MFIAQHLQKMGKLRRSEMFVDKHLAPTELGLSRVATSYKHLAPTELRTCAYSYRALTPFKSVAATLLFLFLPVLALHLFGVDVPGFDLAREPTLTNSRPIDLWLFLPVGYLFTVAVETPVLVIGLSKNFSLKERLFAGLWLTACTYPIVVLVLPILLAHFSRQLYLLVAETFAPVAECTLFWLAFHGRLEPSLKTKLRNFGTIVIANLLSFAGGELLNATRWFGLF
jgi:hypothetical protein